jgi:hypothetical protein
LAGYLPTDHLARFIWQVVEKLDLRELLASYGSDAAGLLGQSLSLCADSGLVNLGVISIDGTKIQANACLAANRTYETLSKELCGRKPRRKAPRRWNGFF